jgi:hypothetical protein
MVEEEEHFVLAGCGPGKRADDEMNYYPQDGIQDYNRTWARLIQKTYEVDPLTCLKCRGQMRILAFIEDEEGIEKILKRLGLWDLKVRPPPKGKAPSVL